MTIEKLCRGSLSTTYIVVACLFCTALSAQVIYVDQDATGDNDGSSWENAYLEFSDALANADTIAEIWVAEGIYFPTTDGNLDSSFVISGHKCIYGGFEGTENSVDERDISSNPTRLSGELVPWNSYFTKIIRCTNYDTLIIDGFIIENARADAIPPGTPCPGFISPCSGAGILVDSFTTDSSLFLLANSQVFANFSVSYGGGMTIVNSNSFSTYLIFDCEFGGGYTSFYGGGLAIQNAGKMKMEIFNSKFDQNLCNADFGYGGGLYYEEVGGAENSSITIEDCEFSFNSSHSGAGITFSSQYTDLIIHSTIFYYNITQWMFNYGGEGAGMLINISNPEVNFEIDRCAFIDNLAKFGGSACDLNTPGAKITNCLFARNRCFEGFSALFFRNFLSSNSSYFVANCSFVENEAGFATIRSHQSVDTIINCLFSDNIYYADNSPDPINHGDLYYSSTQDSLNPLYSVVRNCLFTELDVDSILFISSGDSLVTLADNLFDTDPELKDPANFDYRLSYCSPAVNAGDSTVLLDSILWYDHQNEARYDGKPDIGAYENNEYEISGPKTDISCFGQMDGQIDLTILGGTPPFTLNNQAIPGSSLLVDSLGPGQYDYLVEDAEGCIREATFVLSEPDSLIGYTTAIDASSSSTMDGEIILDSISGGTAPYTITWSTGDTGIWELINIPWGPYVVTILDSNGCELNISVQVSFLDNTEQAFDKNPIQVFPNPSDGSFNILVLAQLSATDWNMQIVDHSGKVIYKRELQRDNLPLNQMSLDLRPGSYFLQFYVRGELFGTKKILIH